MDQGQPDHKSSRLFMPLNAREEEFLNRTEFPAEKIVK